MIFNFIHIYTIFIKNYVVNQSYFMEDFTSEQFNEFKAIGYPRSLSNRDLRGKNFEGFNLAG